MRQFIFDFNGTLFQDTPLHLRTWRDFMALHGVLITEEIFYSEMCGPPNDAILRHFLGDHLTDAQIEQMSFEKESMYRRIVINDPSLQALTPGAEALLDELKTRKIPFAIATSSRFDNVKFYMETLRIDRWFDYDHIFYADGTLPGKPDPAIYLQAMKKLCYTPGDVIVVEDALPGVQSAAAAGVGRIIAIDTTMGPEAFEGVDGVDAVVHDFWDFERFLQD